MPPQVCAYPAHVTANQNGSKHFPRQTEFSHAISLLSVNHINPFQVCIAISLWMLTL